MVRIQDLTPRAGSRARGASAFTELQPILEQSHDVWLEFEADDFVTLSFLDEFVRLLASSEQLVRLTFLLDDDQVRSKLSRIAAARDLDIRVADASRQQSILPREAFSDEVPEFLQEKPDEESLQNGP